MLYCKDCEYLEHKSCMRPIDDPVLGLNVPLKLAARVQRLSESARITNTIGYHVDFGFCGEEAKYFKLDTRPIPQEI